MSQNKLEKLSERLLKLFLTHIIEYDTRCFTEPFLHTCGEFQGWDRVPPIWFAKEMTKRCMEMIAKYKPEDIE